MHEDLYWQAVLTRDRRSDGAFIYAVRSTGIYCKPSCPSRRPRREQVAFFAAPQAAEEAGFRPCQRCHPQGTIQSDPHVEVVQQACRYIEAHSEEPLTLTSLSEQIHMSAYHLQRIFKRVMGITPRQFLQACRIERLKTQMKEGVAVTSALYEAGYGSSSRLYEQAPAQLGMTPGAYRRGGQDMSIRYTIVDCPLGRLLVAATERGLCAVSLGHCDADLEAALSDEYPAAKIQRDETNLHQWVNTLLRHLNGQQPHLDLPLDIQATAFQRRVWEELQTIPYGETCSYGEIAERLGDAKKARAVALACANNPVALVIPCHRVVRGDGSISGYRWGVERKHELLAQEKEHKSQYHAV
jgi:AraC family transcriptional regulator, regulatory protein of adaptative response / methylated-DNA-[protein]-cysteine methyltransferase